MNKWLISEAFRRYDIFVSALADILSYAGERLKDASKESSFPKSEDVVIARYQLEALIKNAEMTEAKYRAKQQKGANEDGETNEKKG